MAEIHWIKLKTTMFDDEKIRLIQSVPESDSILIIWIRLLVLAGKTNDDGLI
ncbi:phage replisome organizer N-terminal domain-containing protein, partial [Oenococcus oeni]